MFESEPSNRKAATVPPPRLIISRGADGRGRLLLSFLYLAVSSIGGQLIGLIGLAVVARYLGPRYLGAYNFANNLSNLFALPLMAGVAMVGMRELALSRGDAPRIISEVRSFQVVNGVVAFVLLVALDPFIAPTPTERILLPIVGGTLIINAFSLDWVMQGLQVSRPLALIRFLGQVVYLAVLLPLLAHGRQGAEIYAIANLAGFATVTVGTTLYARRRVRHRTVRINLRLRLASMRSRARRSLAPGLSLGLVQLYNTIDVVVLGYLATSHQVGEYATAERLPLAVAVFSTLWVTVFYPHAAQLARADREGLRDQVGLFTSAALMLAPVIVPIGLFQGGAILALVFGEAYRGAGLAFGMLLITSVATMVNATLGQVLLAISDDRAVLISVAAGFGVNLALNLALIPLIGMDGSALATICAEVTIVALTTVRFVRVIGPPRLRVRRLAGALCSLLGASCVLVWLEARCVWWLATLCYLVTWGALMSATLTVRRSDVVKAYALRPGRNG